MDPYPSPLFLLRPKFRVKTKLILEKRVRPLLRPEGFFWSFTLSGCPYKIPSFQGTPKKKSRLGDKFLSSV